MSNDAFVKLLVKQRALRCMFVLITVYIYIYTASKVKHHPNIISETFFINEFLQKNNLFVIFCYQVFPWSVKPIRMLFDTFAKVLRCPVYTNFNFGVYT